jgi:hypothetical protein
MRARLIILVVAILAIAGFAALNWPLFMRNETLNFGVVTAPASLPLILLTILGITLLAFLISSATHERRHLVEYREHHKALDAQRDLADKAEASRFTDLRQHIDTQLRENRQREGLAAAEFEKIVSAHQRELRAQLEQMNRTLANRLGDQDARPVAGRGEVIDESRGFDTTADRNRREERNDLRAEDRDHDLRDENRGEGRPDQVRPGGKTIVL